MKKLVFVFFSLFLFSNGVLAEGFVEIPLTMEEYNKISHLLGAESTIPLDSLQNTDEFLMIATVQAGNWLKNTCPSIYKARNGKTLAESCLICEEEQKAEIPLCLSLFLQIVSAIISNAVFCFALYLLFKS